MNFRIAFGLSAYDDSSEFIEDPDYVTLVLQYREWGLIEQRIREYNGPRVHRCRPEEIGIDYYNTKDPEEREKMTKPSFFRPDPSTEHWIEVYSQKLWCTDSDPIVMGNYYTQKARTMVITLNKCDPKERSTCKSDDEIERYLRDKYIIVLENNYNFKQQNYEETKRVESLS